MITHQGFVNGFEICILKKTHSSQVLKECRFLYNKSIFTLITLLSSTAFTLNLVIIILKITYDKKLMQSIRRIINCQFSHLNNKFGKPNEPQNIDFFPSDQVILAIDTIMARSEGGGGQLLHFLIKNRSIQVLEKGTPACH